MHLPLFLAHKFFLSRENKKKRASTPAIHIATAGIAVGLTVMLLAVFIVRGFKNEISEKVTDFAADIEIVNPYYFASPEGFPVVTDTALIEKISQVNGIAHIQRFTEKVGILKTDEEFQAVSFKGVAEDYDTTPIAKYIINGQMPKFSGDKTLGKLVISKMQSDLLSLKVGDKVYAYFFEDAVKMRRFEVAAIYQTNMKQFDKTFVWTDMATVRQLNSWKQNQSSGLEIRLRDFSLLDNATNHLKDMVEEKKDEYGSAYGVINIKQNPRTSGIFNWLSLLDMNIWVILILVLAVAGFSMISGLLILILERTNTIGILKALGSTNAKIRSTFLYYAMFIILRGLLIGNVLSLLLVFIQQKYKVIPLNPETYYMDSVPVQFDPWIWLAINVATLLFTLMALILPSYLVSRVQPAKAIKFD